MLLVKSPSVMPKKQAGFASDQKWKAGRLGNDRPSLGARLV